MCFFILDWSAFPVFLSSIGTSKPDQMKFQCYEKEPNIDKKSRQT